MPKAVSLRVPELPGHGDVGLSRGRPSVELAREVLVETISTLDRPPVVWGYSLGARVTFDLLLSHPGLVRAAIIESGVPGIEDSSLRARRRREDETLSERIAAGTIEQFVDHWEKLPALGEQPAELVAKQREMRLAQSPVALAAALRGLGQAEYPPLWNRVAGIDVPVLLMTGEGDPVYEAHAERLAGLIGRASRASIPGAGHAVHIAQPQLAVEAVLTFVDSLQ
jgi:2-succinyl-6-hydroxy-2,4-cyclohexadiene-1-carboxylate synthase